MIHLLLEERLQAAVLAVLPDAAPDSVTVRPCPDPKFGDYQSASLMALAKTRKANPRQLAEQVRDRLQLADICESVDIAGAGFLNFRILDSVLCQVVHEAALGRHLFFKPAASPRTVVIDFSSPNVAKPMHVGHIRSTILGDALARSLRLLGHQVISDNHIGDWGTQFGMLLQHVRSSHPEAVSHPEQFHIDDLEAFYKAAKKRFDEDPAFADAARRAVVDLQAGDRVALRLWEVFCRESLRHCDQLYARLGVRFDHSLGESFYNSRLEPVVRELEQAGIAVESEGALAVFFESDPQLKSQPAIVRKSDGGFNYMTTDLATLAYRRETWQPDEVIYVTDARQQLHFQQLFAIFCRWHPQARMKLAHVSFGSILGEDGRPFKTRSGETVKLAELLDEAEERAFDVVTEKSPSLPEPKRRQIAAVVGLAAVKYADLRQNRQSDYVFSWEKMLSLDGNTAPYLLYAFARIRSIFRKLQPSAEWSAPPLEHFRLETAEEIALAKHLLNFGMVLDAATSDYRPNYLCEYLYDLAGRFARFYDACPVLKAELPLRHVRLALCDVTARVLRLGLESLGIEPLDQM